MNAAEHQRPLEPYVDDATPLSDRALSDRASSGQTVARSGPELSIIVPTFNERENVAELIARLRVCLGERPWEVIFVGDGDRFQDSGGLVRLLAEAAALRGIAVPLPAAARR